MTDSKLFYRCSICGNLVNVIENSGVSMVCCGQNMDLPIANTTDASTELHVPFITIVDKHIQVQIGEKPHPQTSEHHICWIAAVQGNSIQRVDLSPDGKTPTAKFSIRGKTVTVYAYCNLHGLWKAEKELPEK